MPSSWRLIETDDRAVRELASTLALPEPVVRVLFTRGFSKEDSIDRFLRKSMADLENPTVLSGMKEAVGRLVKAIRNHEKILVHGDFDADGITSTALLIAFLRDIGADVTPFIPNRLLEGHGISRRAMDLASSSGVRLLITCDCGSSNISEISELAKAGIDTIVTDHHEPPQELPPGLVIVNPKLSRGSGAQDDLSGVGVAFMLAVALRARLREEGYFVDRTEPNLKNYLDIVALGTLADMAPLCGQNRILVSHGLDQLRVSSRPGVEAMREKAGLSPSAVIHADDVGFRLAPRINAAARLGHADQALELLLTDRFGRAEELAAQLEAWNTERKELETRMTRLATFDAERQITEGANVVIVSSEDFHPGVIGLVAQKLAQRFGIPAFVFSLQGDEAKGSARSRSGVDLVTALRGCASILVGFGGHREAAGCTLERKRLHEFSQQFRREVALQAVYAAQEILIDAELNLGQVNDRFLTDLNRLRPFGIGNPEPVFRTTAKVLGTPREMGKDHVRVTLHDGAGPTYSAIGFGMYRSIGSFLKGTVQVVYTPEENFWQGRREVRIKLRDVRSV